MDVLWIFYNVDKTSWYMVWIISDGWGFMKLVPLQGTVDGQSVFNDKSLLRKILSLNEWIFYTQYNLVHKDVYVYIYLYRNCDLSCMYKFCL